MQRWAHRRQLTLLLRAYLRERSAWARIRVSPSHAVGLAVSLLMLTCKLLGSGTNAEVAAVGVPLAAKLE